MLQMLDDGRLTDSKGNVVNFRNCIIVFTSNIGSESILEVAGKPDKQVNVVNLNSISIKISFVPTFLEKKIKKHKACFPNVLYMSSASVGPKHVLYMSI